MSEETVKKEEEAKKAKQEKYAAIGCISIIVLAFIIGIILAVSGVGRGPATRPIGAIVEYKITGTASMVYVTLNNAGGGTEQYHNVLVPHTYTFIYYTHSFLYISAQNQGEYGSVTVSIYVDGTLYKTSTSSGAYVIATASGLR